nr:MAG TPA: hypothetical protein [Caudoviricetes sp.]
MMVVLQLVPKRKKFNYFKKLKFSTTEKSSVVHNKKSHPVR